MEARSTIAELKSPEQTAAEMARLAVQYSGDLGELAKMPLLSFFRHVQALPYRRDPAGVETVSRPRLLLQKNYPWRDCDDKAILMASWCVCNARPFAFYATSELAGGRPLHHVFCVTKDAAGVLLPLDSTYAKNKFGAWPRHTFKTILGGSYMPPYLNTLEGSFPELGFSLKSLKKGIVKTVKAPVKAVKASASQLKKGNVIQAAKAAVKPIPYASRTISATQKAAGQVKRGKTLSALKTIGKAATAPARDAAAIIGRNMPDSLKNAVKSAVRKVAGDKVTAATKAAILPAATAAALAIPGVQPFAAAVPVVVNLALDEIAKEAASKAKRTVSKVTSSTAKKAVKALAPSTVKKAISAPVSAASASDNARARASALKNKMEAAKAAQTPETSEDSEAAPGGMSMKMKIGLGVGIGGLTLYALSRKKKGHN